MPGSADKATIKSQFYELANLPGVLGLVDGTHVRIQKPSENEADYVNRHFYHSINVQAICLPDGRFSDVLARFPGSVHNSRIWKLSQVGTYVENNFLVGEHILGDSGYMLKSYLLTPYRQPASNVQENYNYSHKKSSKPLGSGREDFIAFTERSAWLQIKSALLFLHVLFFIIWQLFGSNPCWTIPLLIIIQV